MHRWVLPQEVVPKLERPLLTDPETTIPRAIEVLFGSSPSRRYALVQAAFTQDAVYYNTWVSLRVLWPPSLQRACCAL
jgi:hypothetical protein